MSGELKNCGNCKHGIIDYDRPCVGKSGCFYRKGYPKWEPMTNADMVRRKSDDELAALLWSYRNLGKHVTYQDVMDWLKEVAKE